MIDRDKLIAAVEAVLRGIAGYPALEADEEIIIDTIINYEEFSDALLAELNKSATDNTE